MEAGAPALLADIGGTNARFALLERGVIADVRTLPTARYPSLAEAALAYLAGRPVAAAALAVAGPVTGDEIALTNLGWSFDRAGLAAALGVDALHVVNDFAAQALSLPHLTAADLAQIGGGVATDGPKAILGPGTGLGVSALIPAGGGWLPLATEGGHATLPPTTPKEDAVVARLRARFGHVSAERVLSGPGLVNLYMALAEIDGTPAPLAEPDAITAAGGTGDDALATRTVGMFCDFLGTVAGDLALSVGATGGVYIAGGIVPRLGAEVAASGFRTRFEAKGRFAAYLRPIPTFVVTAEHPAFTGLKALVEGEAA